jgi:hypothetical protein
MTAASVCFTGVWAGATSGDVPNSVEFNLEQLKQKAWLAMQVRWTAITSYQADGLGLKGWKLNLSAHRVDRKLEHTQQHWDPTTCMAVESHGRINQPLCIGPTSPSPGPKCAHSCPRLQVRRELGVGNLDADMDEPPVSKVSIPWKLASLAVCRS